jgi:hypothetical protein
LWPQLVGTSLAESTRVVGLDGGRIVIRVPDQAWQRQLASIRGRLLDRVNEPFAHRWITGIGFTHEDKRN